MVRVEPSRMSSMLGNLEISVKGWHTELLVFEHASLHCGGAGQLLANLGLRIA